MSLPRVLVVAHGHPDFSVGGGELAAYAQFRELQRRGIESLFVARSSQSAGHAGAAFSNRSADGREVLFSAPPVNHFRHSQPDKRVIVQDFRALLERFNPTVVHFHHYVHLGLEMIREVRKFMPHGKIVLTLHEYLGICHAQGQMLKTNGILCTRSGPLDCHQCFPDISPQDFFMREMFVKSFFNLCDHFVSPSAFLRERYIEWGLPAAKISVIENGQPESNRETRRPAAPLYTRFVVLGQLSRLKGTLVVLEAARLLPRALRTRISIEIHGSMQHESAEFKALFHSELAKVSRTVRYGGPYRPAEVSAIIQEQGWVIQPSIWWENSPLVIQEAFAAARPVICSNIGGLAEKVTHGVSGLHFRVGSASDLSRRLEEAATDPVLWERLCDGVPRPPSIGQAVDSLMGLYTEGSPNEASSGNGVATLPEARKARPKTARSAGPSVRTL